MNTLQFNNQIYDLAPDESVLQCFLRHRIDYPYSCQAGICQSCLIKIKEGDIHPDWQAGLPPTIKSQGYFLACLAKPSSSLKVIPPNAAECEIDAEILSLNQLNHNVIQVKLGLSHPDLWLPGQYLTFINPDGVTRNYSIANIPAQDKYIELHVKIKFHGILGQWFLQKAAIKTAVTLRGPFGQCYYYNPDKLPFTIFLAGTGTGIAPLVGIIRSAIQLHHRGKIILVQGGVTDEDIYYKNEIRELAASFANVSYDPCVLRTQGLYPEASIEKRILMHLIDPKQVQAYVCGPTETTKKIKTQLFLAGVPSAKINSDEFL